MKSQNSTEAENVETPEVPPESPEMNVDAPNGSSEPPDGAVETPKETNEVDEGMCSLNGCSDGESTEL